MFRHQRMVILLGFALFIPLGVRAQDATENHHLEKLEAFARTYGYVRYFHPSDQANLVDWDAMAVYGVNRILNSDESQSTESLLQKLFEPIVVDLEFYRGDEKARPATRKVSEDEILVWQHSGVEMGRSGIYRSARTNRSTEKPTQASPFGNVMQSFSAKDMRGKEIRFRFHAKIIEGEARIQGWLRADLTEGMGLFDNMGDRPIRSDEWQEYEITGTMDDDAERVTFGFMFMGTGTGAIDDAHFEIKEDGDWKEFELRNPDFEEGSRTPTGWAARGQGYRFRLTEENPVNGEKALTISRSTRTQQGGILDILPELGEVIDAKLVGDLRVRMPLALVADEEYLIDDADATAQLLEMLDEIAPEDAEQATLCASNVIIAWNVFQHFYPYFEQVDTDWDATLTQSLQKALGSKSRKDTTKTIQWLVAQLHDGHGSVFDIKAARQNPRGLIPVQFGWVENQLVVLGSADNRLKAGDIVTQVGNQSSKDYLQDQEEFISGSPQWKRYRSTQGLSIGERGTELSMTLQRGEEDFQVGFKFDGQAPFQVAKKEKVDVLVEGDTVEETIYYIDLGRVEPKDVQPMIDEFSKAKGIVLDLRGYPRGTQFLFQHMTDEHMQSQKWQVPEQVRPDRVDMQTIRTRGRWEMPPQTPRFQGTMVFLTNASAISYAESCMAIVANYELGEIIGSPTAGANGNVNPFQLADGWRVSWTGMRVMNHDDSQHHVNGVQPTIPLEPTIQGIREGRDELIEKALEVINEAEAEE